MAEKLTIELKGKREPKPAADKAAPEPARTLEEVYKPDAPVVQKLVLMDRSQTLAPKKKARTMSDIKV